MSVEIPNIEKIYFKFPLIGMYSKVTQNKIESLCKRFCNKAKVELDFTNDKLRQTSLYKDSYPSVLSSKLFYKRVWASCNASFVGLKHRHLTSKIDEQFGKNKMSHRYLQLVNVNAFSVLDTARTKHHFWIKENGFINW